MYCRPKILFSFFTLFLLSASTGIFAMNKEETTEEKEIRGVTSALVELKKELGENFTHVIQASVIEEAEKTKKFEDVCIIIKELDESAAEKRVMSQFDKAIIIHQLSTRLSQIIIDNLMDYFMDNKYEDMLDIYKDMIENYKLLYLMTGETNYLYKLKNCYIIVGDADNALLIDNKISQQK